MHKRKIIFFLFLFGGFLFIFSLESIARIIVKDNTIIFMLDSSPPAKDKQRIERVVQFEEEIKYDETKDPVKKNELGINPLAVHRLKGKKFAISTDKRFAVILDYSCTKLRYAGEIPWECDAAAMVLDSEGYVLNKSTIKGNFLFIQNHDSLPYFILWDSTCCDGPIHAVLFNLRGEKVCEAFDFQDESWFNHTQFTCIGKTIDQISHVNLTARLIDGHASIYDRPDGNIIGSLSDHARVHILEEKNNWVLVDDNSKQGWIYKKNLKNGFVSLAKKTDLPQDPIERLVFRLKDKNLTVRRMAGKALASRGDKRAMAALLTAIENKNPDIRSAVIYAIYQLSYTNIPQWVDPLIGRLKKENDIDILQYIILTLGQIGSKKATGPLVDLLNHKDNIVRWAAAFSLGNIRDPRAVKPLINCLKDKDIFVVRCVIQALGKIKDASTVLPLITLLKDQYPFHKRNHTVVSHIIDALGKIKDASAAEPLIILLKDQYSMYKDNLSTVADIIQALGEIKDASAVAPLINMLKDPFHKSKLIVFNIIEALAKIKDASAAEPLITLLKDHLPFHQGNLSLVNRIIQALDKIEDASAVAPLISILKEKDQPPYHICQRAASALKNITNQDFGKDYHQWLKWWKEKNNREE